MVASEITNMWVCSECEVMDDIWYVYICQVDPYFCTNLGVHNFSTPLAMDSFLHAKSGVHATFLSSYTSSNPVTTFIFSINSYLTPLHALHLIRKCITSSISPLSHSVHFLSSLVNLSFFPRPPATLCVIEMEQIIRHT